MWSRETSCGREWAKIKYDIVPYTRGRGLDLGSGAEKPYRHFISVDNGANLAGSKTNPDIWGDCTDLSVFADGSMDFVFSSHLLEHIQDYKSALAEWWRVIRNSGYLVLYLPHKDYYPNVGEPNGNPDHKHDFVQEDIIGAMQAVGGWTLLVNELRTEGDEYSFLQVYMKRKDGVQFVPVKDDEQPKRACVVRYGGFGDMMQTTSVLAALKSKGYMVTLMTHTEAHDLMCHDPNIDTFLMQDKEQVPNQELGEYWSVWEKKFDLFVNLSESVEATWLALPGRTPHRWPQSVRAKYLDANYLEFMHDLAKCGDVKPKITHYPSPENAKWAQEKRKDLGGKVVLFALAGSSVHKFYPHMDAVIARLLLEFPEVQIVLTGDMACKLLEQGWEAEQRVHRWSGEVGIDKVLAFSKLADVVIGPETGVLSAVAHEWNGKVVLMSHSSPNNLTRGWFNTVPLQPEDCYCHPCHQMHYGWDHCTAVTDQEGGIVGALCMYNITPDRAFTAVRNLLNGTIW